MTAARVQAVLAAALDPIIIIDCYGIIQSASDSVQRVFGWTAAELTGRNVNVLMPEPYHSAHDGYLARYRITGVTNILGRTREFDAVRKNGERFPIELSVSRVDLPDGSLPLFVGILRDVTERKRLERELRLVQSLALSIGNAPSLADARIETLRQICMATEWDYGEVWAPEPNGDHLVGTASWMRPDSGLASFTETMTNLRLPIGFSLAGQSAATGRPIWIADLSTADPAAFLRTEAAKAVGLRAAAAVPVHSDDQLICVFIFFVRRSRSEDLHLLALVQAALAPLGTLIQRKRAEGELEQYRRHLEEIVQQRTRALAESQDKLRFADRLASIGTLAAGLGHDMNNVLLPVRAHLNALREEAKDGTISETARKHVDAVAKSVAYLQQLADGLHFLATDPEKDDGSSGTVNVENWWAQAGALISKAVPKHVRVTASFPPNLPAASITAAGLTQAMLNLVVNAGEAIPAQRKRRQGHVRIWAKPSDDGQWIKLGVTDNGSGMTEEVKRRAFDMFFTTKSRGLGTGLGLSLVRNVVNRAGGSVEIESAPGKGTTVVLTLPAIAPQLESDARTTAVITVGDGRAAALLRNLLEAAGIETTVGDDPGHTDIWIVSPSPQRHSKAKSWRSKRPNARVIVFGKPDDAHAAKWKSLDAILIDDPDDFEAIRSAIDLAMDKTA